MGGKNKKPIRFDYDLVVLGAGTAGSIAANLAANKGKKVVVIEKNKVGGEQIWSTTIPTKWLIESLKQYHGSLSASKFGLDIQVGSLDQQKLKHYCKKSQTQAAISETVEFKDENIETIKGSARFIDKYHIKVNNKIISFKKLLIATGSSPKANLTKPFNIDKFLTYKELSELSFQGKSFCFVGAGAVAYEYSQILSMMGLKVHIIEKNSHILPHLDSEVSDLAEDVLLKQGVNLHTSSYIEDIKQDNDKTIILFIKNQRRYRLVIDNIVISMGKKPNVSSLLLENANIHFDENGVKTNKKMQTKQKHIYAAGEVAGATSGYESANEAQIAIHNMFFRKKLSKQNTIPKVIYGSSEIAVIGKSELSLKLSGKLYQSSIAPIGILGKSLTTGYDSGFVKILANDKGIVIGGSIVAPNASELINILALAVSSKMPACKIANTIFASPSWSEAIKIAASKIYCI